MFDSLNSTPLSSDPQFDCLVSAFLNELDPDERAEIRAAAAQFVAVCAPDVPEHEARQFFYYACPGFHAFEAFWLTLPTWQRYSNATCDRLHGYERAAVKCYGRKGARS